MTAPRIFSEADSLKLIELVKAGSTIDALSKAYRCSKETVYRELRKHKISTGYPKKRLFTASEIEQVLRAARAGECSKWVAERLKRTRQTVICVARRHGAPFVDPNKPRSNGKARNVSDRNPYTPTQEQMAAFVAAGKAELSRVRA
ncbi:MAG: helix-turn-helix domain-containing protein [Pseudorhodoplanes sp.]